MPAAQEPDAGVDDVDKEKGDDRVEEHDIKHEVFVPLQPKTGVNVTINF
jgi:hypothetical protein